MWSFRKAFGLLLFLSSYAVLHAGLYGALVYYDHEMKLEKKMFKGTKDESLFDGIVFLDKMAGDKPIKVIPPTTRSLIGDLPPPKKGEWPQWSMLHCLLDKADKGEASYVAPYTLLLFGVYLPLLKFVSVMYWVFALPGSTQVLQFAKNLCRWAAVDAVAEAMIVALLLRGGVDAEHRMGYVCFVGFCFLSTFSIWIMKEGKQPAGPGLSARLVLRASGGRSPPRCLTLLTFLFFLAAFLNGAIMHPLASISVPKGPIEENIHDGLGAHHKVLLKLIGEKRLDRLLEEILNSIPIPYGVATVLEASEALLYSGHEYTVAGSIFLLTGVLITPFLEALMATFLALDSRAGRPLPAASKSTNGPGRQFYSGAALFTAKVMECCGDLALLDVYLFGMFVAALVLSSIGEVLRCELLQGFYLLIPAVLMGYLHHAVCGAVVLGRQRAALAEATLALDAGEYEPLKGCKNALQDDIEMQDGQASRPPSRTAPAGRLPKPAKPAKSRPAEAKPGTAPAE